MANQKHTLNLVAKLDTSDVQRELARLNGGRGVTLGTRATGGGGGAYPSGTSRGENSLALAANRLGTAFDRLQGVFGRLEKGFGSLDTQVAGFKDSLRGMTRAVDNAKRAAERSTKSASTVGYERFRDRYSDALRIERDSRSAAVERAFDRLESMGATPRGHVKLLYARVMQDIALHALAEQGLAPEKAYRYYTSAGMLGTLQRVGGNVIAASVGPLSIFNPKYLKRNSAISHMRPGSVAMPSLFRAFGSVFSPENDPRNYQFVDQSNPDAMARRAEELRRAGGSARRWAAMFAAQAVFSGGQRLASAYGATGASKGLGLLGSTVSGAIGGGAIGGMFGLGAGALPGAVIGGALGFGSGVVNLVAGNVEERRADEASVANLRKRMTQYFGLRELAEIGAGRAGELLAERSPLLGESQAKILGWGSRDAEGLQAETERYSFLQQQVALLKQVTDAERNRVEALRASYRAFDQMKNSRAWGQHMGMFAEGKNLLALNRILGSEVAAMNGATSASDYSVHAARVDQLKAMIKAVEDEFRAMGELRSGRAFGGLMTGLVKSGELQVLTDMVAQFEELAKNATGLKELSDALSKLSAIEGAQARVRAFEDMKENWKYGGWIFSLGKDKNLTLLHSAYWEERNRRDNATNVEDWNLAEGRVKNIQATASEVVREMVKDLEDRMPKFDASLTTSLAQFGIGMGEANDNVNRQMKVWEEQTEIQKQIKELLEQNAWTASYD